MNEDQTPEENIVPREDQALSKKERRELRREEKRTAADSFRKARSLRRAVLWIIAIAAIGGAIAGAAYFAMNAGDKADTGGALTNALSSADWVRGNPDAAVTFVEYGDFQCPACAQFHGLLNIMKTEFGNDVAFSFRHFPLIQAHPNAKDAARAAEAAGIQGKFWEMHDILFERQSEWAPKPRPQATFVDYAKELGLNIDQFEDDMDRDDIDDKIDSHYQTGTASGVNSTPTFFLNGVKIENPRSYDEFKHALSQAVEAARTKENSPANDTASSSETSITPPHEADL